MAAFRVIYDRTAEADIANLHSYLTGVRSAAFADAFVGQVMVYCEGLTHFPHRGTMRNEIRPGLRSLGWKRTITIGFRINEGDSIVVILAVLYRGRDVATAMRARP